MVVVKVRNASATQGSWIFTTGRGSLSSFHLYEASNRGLALLVDGSDAAAARANLRTYQAFSTELILAPGQEKLLMVDFLSENSTYMPIRIPTYGSFLKALRDNVAVVRGAVIGIGVLNLLNFLV